MIANRLRRVPEIVRSLMHIDGARGLMIDAAGGALTNGRTSTATVIDFEGLVKTCKANEIRYSGARRVENLLTASNDLTNAAWTKAGAVNAPSANVVQFPNLSESIYQSNTSQGGAIGRKYTFSSKLSGSGTCYIGVARVGTGAYEQTIVKITLTTEPVRYTISHTIVNSNQTGALGLISRGADGTATTVGVSDSQLEHTTGQANQNTSEYASSTSTHNSGVAGVKYFNTQNGNTVVSNVVTEATGAAISPAPAILHEGAATNYFLQSGAPATQIITLAAGTYTCWLDDTNGLGSITLVGGATGVATAATPLTFVASGAAITFTVAGAANVRAQVEGGSYRTSYIATTTAAINRAIDSIKLPEVLNSNFFQERGISLVKLKMKFANSASNKAILAYNTGATDFIYDNGSGGIALADGTNTATATVGGWAADDTLLIAACRNKRNGLMSVHVSKNGGAWVDSSDTAYDGSVSAGANILLSSGSTDSIEFNHVKLYKTTKSFAAMQRWIKTKAAQEAA